MTDASETPKPPDQPVLHPGGRPGQPVATGGDSAEEQRRPAANLAPDAVPAENTDEDAAEERRRFQRAQQKRKRLLQQCERVLLLEFNRLSLPDWPDNYAVAEARRRRDIWIAVLCILGAVFLAGALHLAPAWLGGIGFGGFVLVTLLGVPMIRRFVTDRPSWMDLLLIRRRMMREAQAHVRHLEGNNGLAWQCAAMRDYNAVLDRPRFSAILRLSESGMLASALRTRAHMRLYLIFMLEAEKAYQRMQANYLANVQEAAAQGWIDSSGTDTEGDSGPASDEKGATADAGTAPPAAG